MDNSVNPAKGKTATRPVVQQLKDRPRASVLIVGGGINGVGTFRDLSLQGVDVALVERGDYCQGASGASSHMIHGGIRYLENGEFRLVHESVVERNALLRLAPHYVKPLQTTIPITSTFSGITAAPMRFLTHKPGKPNERGALLIKAGLVMYDFFSRGGRVAPRHNFVGKKKSLQELPKLRSDVKYTATYFDASVHNPERLTLDVLRDGLEANPQSRASNYVSAVGTTDAGTMLRDELTGEEFLFEADVVINATGAWVDETNDSFGKRTSFMGGTKGSHIVLDHPELLEACNGRELFFEHTDGRIVLIYPMGDRVLVGTTDIDADINEASVCTDEEIEYFFELVAHVFPTIDVRRDHIVYTFSGVRPLPKHDDTQPGFVSRDYRIEKRIDRRAGKNVTTLSLVGGKWTTFRALSENLASEAMTALGMPRKTTTSELQIGGGKGFPSTEAEERLWVNRTANEVADRDRVRVLLTRYGTRATDVLEFLAQGGDQLLASTNELSTRELTYMVENEQITRLADILIRRTSLAFRGLVTEEMLNELAGLLAPQLGWDEAEAHRQVQSARDLLVNMHGMKIGASVA
ncbi:glycerol-3-phosphate dehydrogenase [Arthrobacter sp. UYP6]|uniref:glycerol-3-phosphate dehydrogenase/oxidase n=1 Tax=Arthrobacter sp. UYP6 TaxID=1756378 RepID=UPI0033984C0C